jgi:hypothetical protein
MAITSARLFLERAGIYSTNRAPVPTVNFRELGVNDPDGYPWNNIPLPIPELLPVHETDSTGGVTVEPWPHGE